MRVFGHWLTMAGTIIALTAGGVATHINPTTMGFTYLIAVVFLSAWAGLRIGVAASIVATFCYNFFFLPPLHTLHVEDPRNWVALSAFLFSSLMVTRLVLAARSQAAEAERRRIEVEANAHIEALRESDALKTSLLRALSHDLSTPLTAISIQTESLKRQTAGAPELAGTVAAIADETSRLRRRIDNLLTMARLEAGRFAPHPEPTPPADIFRSVRESLPLVFSSRPVAISVAADCPDAYVDPWLALEIMVNLVENAHRASATGAPIELAAAPLDSRVRLEVLDRGPGISHDSDVAQRGLGLEIARSLAAASGGSFELENRNGGGAVARVELPAAVLAAEGDAE